MDADEDALYEREVGMKKGVAEIRPFAGYRYVLKTPGDLATLVSPPYDMIDGPMIDRLYDTDPCNVVRIIQNRKEPTDQSNKDRHARAAAFLDRWIASGVLARDRSPSLYVYEQEFSLLRGEQTVTYKRTAVITLVRLVDYSEGVVFPHENTLLGSCRSRLIEVGALFCGWDSPPSAVPPRISPSCAMKWSRNASGSPSRNFSIYSVQQI